MVLIYINKIDLTSRLLGYLTNLVSVNDGHAWEDVNAGLCCAVLCLAAVPLLADVGGSK